MDISSPIAEIKSLVAESRTSDALSRLLELSQSNKQVHDAILILSGEFSDLTSQQLKGTIDNSEATRRRNVVHDKILIALWAFDSLGRVVPGSGVVAKSSATRILGRLTLLSMGLSAALFSIMHLHNKSLSQENYWEYRWDESYALVPSFLGFWIFIAYLLAMVVSASKK